MYSLKNANLTVTVAGRGAELQSILGADGTEYLFTAVNLPREDKPDMPTDEIQVYVTVEKDKAPVFTKVIR